MPASLRQTLQSAAVAGLFVPIWSPWIIGELYRVLTWQWVEKFGLSKAEQRRCFNAANRMMILLGNYWELVNIPQPWPTAWPELQDPNDQPIWATAVTGQAQYVVSDNTSDFPPQDAQGKHIWQDIEYIPPATFFTDILFLSSNPRP